MHIISDAAVYFFNLWRVRDPVRDDQEKGHHQLLQDLSDLNLSERFRTGRTTVSNTVLNLVHVFHELLDTGVLLAVDIPSQLKCKASMPVCCRFCRSVDITVLLFDYDLYTSIPQALILSGKYQSINPQKVIKAKYHFHALQTLQVSTSSKLTCYDMSGKILNVALD